MKTLILNGSPKAKRGNSEIFIQHFTKGMKDEYEVRYITKEAPEKLAAYAEQFDALIFVFPIYIHSMPSGMMRLIEHLRTCKEGEKKSIGFIYQRGFAESIHCQPVEQYFELLAKELGRNYLGTISKGDAAGVYLMPKFATRKLFARLQAIGKDYEAHHRLEQSLLGNLQPPRRLGPVILKMQKGLTTIGAHKLIWHKFMRENGVLDQALARPFDVENKRNVAMK